MHQAIGMLEGLIISSDMQKELIKVVSQVYSLAEHKEYMRDIFIIISRNTFQWTLLNWSLGCCLSIASYEVEANSKQQ
jgi:hypothetical protein